MKSFPNVDGGVGRGGGGSLSKGFILGFLLEGVLELTEDPGCNMPSVIFVTRSWSYLILPRDSL